MKTEGANVLALLGLLLLDLASGIDSISGRHLLRRFC